MKEEMAKLKAEKDKREQNKETENAELTKEGAQPAVVVAEDPKMKEELDRLMKQLGKREAKLKKKKEALAALQLSMKELSSEKVVTAATQSC